jgi:uncharacterized protein YndB with AHSA1/START domain
MSNRSAQHATFVIERTYAAAPARVFAAFADPAAKARWFEGPAGWKLEIREVDFRVGGKERVRGVFPDGLASDFQCTYHDIVPDQRIVYAYDMYHGEKKLSVSLATIEVEPAGGGTRLTVTEQGVFLDGYDGADSREEGTRGLLDRLESRLGLERAKA